MVSDADWDHHHIWPPYSSLRPLEHRPQLVRGSGVWLFDDAGNKYLDAISSWWVNLHGHAHPVLAEALYAQAKELEHSIFAGFTHSPAIALTQKLLPLLPTMKRAFFSDNGSTAVEVALKMALHYSALKNENRMRIIAIEGAFHGDTFGAMAVSGRGGFHTAFENLLFEVDYIPFPEKGKEERALEAMLKLAQSGLHAAFIFEPLVQGAAGMRMYSADVLSALMECAKQHEVLCIADEVMTGFGRTGTLFAHEQASSSPDLICLSKGLTGGAMPMGLTIVNEKVEAPFLKEGFEHRFLHGHSYTANALACAVALASLELTISSECSMQRERLTVFFKELENRLSETFPQVAFRTMGCIWAMEFLGEADDYQSTFRDELYHFALQKGVLLRPLGRVVYVIPPYCIDNEELKIIEEVLIHMLEVFTKRKN
jgi:adenosylmethionine-8-amino-7-oxononanoate aminotransferase